LLPEIREPPHILSEVDAALKVKQMKADVDEYLKVFSVRPLYATV
jgi:CCR4-NOT transcription complex subunit 1